MAAGRSASCRSAERGQVAHVAELRSASCGGFRGRAGAGAPPCACGSSIPGVGAGASLARLAPNGDPDPSAPARPASSSG